MLLWLEFIVTAAVIVFCGTNLSRYGDVIAEKSGMGRAWIGLILMASITSLPELVTGVSSVTMADVPNIAVGNVMGACIFNMLILALLDPMDKGSPICSKVGQSHLLSAGFAMLLVGTVSASIMLEGVLPSFFHIGIYTPIIVIMYVVGIRAVYFYEKRFLKKMVEEAASKALYDHISTKRAVVLYALNAAVVIAVASMLPFIAEGLAEQTGLGNHFMGTVFVAMTTTLPELVVSVSAIR